MKLFYYQDPEGNFGDDLNAWLWPRLLPDLLDDDESTLFVGIGSILDRRIPQEPQKVVFGTGVGYGLLPVLDERWQFYCVRGPLTAQALGLPAHMSVTDPAMLVRLVRPAPTARVHKISFIPHFRTPARAESIGIDLRTLCASIGVNYIDPRGKVEQVLADIETSEKVLAEAMHGAIVADALRIPWVPVQLFDQILNLKWQDWCSTLGLDYSPLRYPGYPGHSGHSRHSGHLAEPGIDHEASMKRFLGEAAINISPVQSLDIVLERLIDQLLIRLEALKTGRPDFNLRGSEEFRPDPGVLREVPWLYEMQSALEELAEVVPPGAMLILVDEERWGGRQALRGRRTLPFLERDGLYWGLPPDSDTAISELERLRGLGAEYLVFMWPSFWWLNHYAGLSDHLGRYTTLVSSDRIIVISLILEAQLPE